MKRFNEGKACDAVIRHIEARESSSRQNLRSPERRKDPHLARDSEPSMEEAPVELTCWIGGRLFAFEHTGIEPFEGQIKLEAEARFKPLRDMFSGLIPKGEQYELYVPVRATLDLKKAQARSIILALSDWIRAEAPGLQLSPVGRFGTPATRQRDTIIPFEVALHRNSLPGLGHFSITYVVDQLDDSRKTRIERACQKKLPKLAVWKARGARTVLILEATDDQLTNAVDVAASVLRAEKTIGDEPDEIYFVFSAIIPWWVWHVRVGTRSFFDLDNPNDRAWEVDPQTLLSLTNR
jgi:hypothetical protein